MFDNIGGKIKALAKVTCWVGIVSWVFIGIAIIAVSEILAPHRDYRSNCRSLPILD